MNINDKQNSTSIVIIEDIIEDEFGCEGRPEGEEPQVTIIVTDKNGTKQQIRMPDKLAYERKLEVGQNVVLQKDGTLIRTAVI